MGEIDLGNPEDLPEMRSTLREAGIDPEALTDEEVVTALKALLEEAVPAPAVPAGSPPVSARVWLSDALAAGGNFRQPDDPEQRARLEDGGPTVHLAVLGVLVMRHKSASRPEGWSNRELAEQIGQPVEDFARGQGLLDDVATATGVAATPEPRWWERG